MNDFIYFISFLLTLLLPLFCCICGVIEVKHAKSEQQPEESDMKQHPNRDKAIAIGLAKCICAFGALSVACIYIIAHVSSYNIFGCLFLIAVAILIFWHIYLKRLLGKSKLMTQKSISEWSTIGNCAIIMPIILFIMYLVMEGVYFESLHEYNKYQDNGTVFTQILQEIGACQMKIESIHKSIMAGILFATAVLGILIIYRTRNNRE